MNERSAPPPAAAADAPSPSPAVTPAAASDSASPGHNQGGPLHLIPFLKLLGLEKEAAPPGESRLLLPELKPEHCNLLPAAHGGVVMTLLDVAMARAAISVPDAPGTTVVTVEMSSRFLHPARGVLRASGRVLHAGRSLCTCEAQVLMADGRVAATAQGTFKYWRGPMGGVE